MHGPALQLKRPREQVQNMALSGNTGGRRKESHVVIPCPVPRGSLQVSKGQVESFMMKSTGCNSRIISCLHFTQGMLPLYPSQVLRMLHQCIQPKHRRHPDLPTAMRIPIIMLSTSIPNDLLAK